LTKRLTPSIYSMAVQCIDIHWRCVVKASPMWGLLKQHYGGDIDQKQHSAVQSHFR